MSPEAPVPRVLVVDDEPVIALCVQAFLEDDGMLVTTVRSGEEALARVGAGDRFDVCIMDVRLPGMDGATAVARLAALCPALRFAMHTGSAEYTLPDELEELGDIPLLHKPLRDMSPLAATVRRLAGAGASARAGRRP
ncbi:response regulator [Azohydromonas lata]|uniref:Response regulator n=1 Tax=Azohydromonas lata TaxID=45677 RepID=A0ABU5IRL4_9BURK|nr:response regulator [Azohydromonas lata]MDZ5461520.1 response regulator [Azohydromonas lata]